MICFNWYWLNRNKTKPKKKMHFSWKKLFFFVFAPHLNQTHLPNLSFPKSMSICSLLFLFILYVVTIPLRSYQLIIIIFQLFCCFYFLVLLFSVFIQFCVIKTHSFQLNWSCITIYNYCKTVYWPKIILLLQ